MRDYYEVGDQWATTGTQVEVMGFDYNNQDKIVYDVRIGSEFDSSRKWMDAQTLGQFVRHMTQKKVSGYPINADTIYELLDNVTSWQQAAGL